MALDFPTSPTDGQTFNQYVYDATAGAWQLDRPSSDKTPVDAIVSVASVTPTYDGDAAVYSFTSDGTITIETAGYADVLVVGGGGAGGNSYGGGGGAGGMLYVTNAFLPAGSLEVNVGAGGVTYEPASNTGATGYNGEASSLWNYYAPGGGGGGGMSNKSGTSQAWPINGSGGGSGGGAGGQYNTAGQTQGFGGTPTVNQGNTGGRANYLGSGGGGGAGSAGVTGVQSGGGDGGSGLSNSITGSAVFYAGGGGGTSNGASTQGSGGSGIGGDGDLNTATDGTANTGSGGGGAASGGGSGAGGSGIVIVRIGGDGGS